MKERLELVITLRIVAVMFFVGILSGPVPSDTNGANVVTVPAASEDSVTVDYRDGSWWADSVRVSLDCPTDDSCDFDYRDDSWVFTRVAH